MEVGDRQRSPYWQHVNGGNEGGRASYHNLPPIASITSCRPSSAPTAKERKDEHVFSVPVNPAPKLAPMAPRAPTPFPEQPSLDHRTPSPSLIPAGTSIQQENEESTRPSLTPSPSQQYWERPPPAPSPSQARLPFPSSPNTSVPSTPQGLTVLTTSSTSSLNSSNAPSPQQQFSPRPASIPSPHSSFNNPHRNSPCPSPLSRSAPSPSYFRPPHSQLSPAAALQVSPYFSVDPIRSPKSNPSPSSQPPSQMRSPHSSQVPSPSSRVTSTPESISQQFQNRPLNSPNQPASHLQIAHSPSSHSSVHGQQSQSPNHSSPHAVPRTTYSNPAPAPSSQLHTNLKSPYSIPPQSPLSHSPAHTKQVEETSMPDPNVGRGPYSDDIGSSSSRISQLDRTFTSSNVVSKQTIWPETSCEGQGRVEIAPSSSRAATPKGAFVPIHRTAPPQTGPIISPQSITPKSVNMSASASFSAPDKLSFHPNPSDALPSLNPGSQGYDERKNLFSYPIPSSDRFALSAFTSSSQSSHLAALPPSDTLAYQGKQSSVNRATVDVDKQLQRLNLPQQSSVSVERLKRPEATESKQLHSSPYQIEPSNYAQTFPETDSHEKSHYVAPPSQSGQEHKAGLPRMQLSHRLPENTFNWQQHRGSITPEQTVRHKLHASLSTSNFAAERPSVSGSHRPASNAPDVNTTGRGPSPALPLHLSQNSVNKVEITPIPHHSLPVTKSLTPYAQHRSAGHTNFQSLEIYPVGQRMVPQRESADVRPNTSTPSSSLNVSLTQHPHLSIAPHNYPSKPAQPSHLSEHRNSGMPPEPHRGYRMDQSSKAQLSSPRHDLQQSFQRANELNLTQCTPYPPQSSSYSMPHHSREPLDSRQRVPTAPSHVLQNHQHSQEVGGKHPSMHHQPGPSRISSTSSTAPAFAHTEHVGRGPYSRAGATPSHPYARSTVNSIQPNLSHVPKAPPLIPDRPAGHASLPSSSSQSSLYHRPDTSNIIGTPPSSRPNEVPHPSHMKPNRTYSSPALDKSSPQQTSNSMAQLYRVTNAFPNIQVPSSNVQIQNSPRMEPSSATNMLPSCDPRFVAPNYEAGRTSDASHRADYPYANSRPSASSSKKPHSSEGLTSLPRVNFPTPNAVSFGSTSSSNTYTSSISSLSSQSTLTQARNPVRDAPKQAVYPQSRQLSFSHGLTANSYSYPQSNLAPHSASMTRVVPSMHPAHPSKYPNSQRGYPTVFSQQAPRLELNQPTITSSRHQQNTGVTSPTYRGITSQYLPPPRAADSDTCRNPFELPPPSSYAGSHSSSTVIKALPHQTSNASHAQKGDGKGSGYPVKRSYEGFITNESSRRHPVPATGYQQPPPRIEERSASASDERQKPPTTSARFPPVPQSDYDLQRQIYDRMRGLHQNPPRLVEKAIERRQPAERQVSLAKMEDSNKVAQPQRPVLANSVRQKRESPLDLSVKTVRQSADSTRDDVDLYLTKHFAPEALLASAPKIDFNPNFSNPPGQSDTRHLVSLPPVQTIRFHSPPSDTSPHQFRKRHFPEAEVGIPSKIPKVDAWKLAMDEQIEERLNAARISRAQPPAPSFHTSSQSKSTNLEHMPHPVRQPGFPPAAMYNTHQPSAAPNRFGPPMVRMTQQQMGQQERHVRYPGDNRMHRDWNQASIHSFRKQRPDPEQLVEQISKGVIADSRLLQDRNVVSIIQSSIEEKEARLQQLQKASARHHGLPSFDQINVERMCVPPSYKHGQQRGVEAVPIGIEPTNNYLRGTDDKQSSGPEIDGFDAFMAARIRTKAEMKQMGPTMDSFRPQVEISALSGRTNMTGTSPPKLMREHRQQLRGLGIEEPPTSAHHSAPVRDPTGLRSSSETSVFDFRESDSEGEMPVLERQTLEGMRRDRKPHSRASAQSLDVITDPAPEFLPEPERELEPDSLWENACDMFVEQLTKRPVKRSVRKKKPNPKFFANEAEAPGFLKVNAEVENSKTEPVEVKETNQKSVEQPVQKIETEPAVESDVVVPPLPVTCKEEEDSSSSEELAMTAVKEGKRKVTSRQRQASESEWDSSEASDLGSSTSRESSESSESESESNDSETSVAPKNGRRVQTRQSARSQKPQPSMKLRSKKRDKGKEGAFQPGWEDEVVKFKQQLRMPDRLINVTKPKKRAPSLPDFDSSEEKSLTDKSPKKLKKGKQKTAKKGESNSPGKTKSKNKRGKKVEDSDNNDDEEVDEEETNNVFSKSRKSRPSSAPPLTRRHQIGMVTRGREKLLPKQADKKSAGVIRSNKAIENSKRRLNKGNKKMKLRRKFRSGFDYVRKKKKQLGTKKEGDTGTPPPEKTEAAPKQRRERSDFADISSEVKSWVVNKSAGETILHRAARLGYADVAAYCLESLNMPPSPRDHAGYTPLHEACSRGHLDVANMLLMYGASISESARGGVRPLHQAAENNYMELIRLLLSYGADPLLATYTGQTALSLTTSEEVRILLVQHLADVQGEDAPKWTFDGPASVFDPDWAVNPLENPPSPNPVPVEVEIEASPAVLPPLYRFANDDASERWVMLDDVVAYTKSRAPEIVLSKLPNTPRRQLAESDFRDRLMCCSLTSGTKPQGKQIQIIRYDDAVRKLLQVDVLTVSLSLNP